MEEELKVVQPHPCAKCGAAMEFGLLVDRSGEEHRELTAQWVRGRPDTSFFLRRFKASGPGRLEVKTLRCVGCGFLEMYAR